MGKKVIINYGSYQNLKTKANIYGSRLRKIKTCPYCGESFLTARITAIYCSDSCRSSACRDRKKQTLNKST